MISDRSLSVITRNSSVEFAYLEKSFKTSTFTAWKVDEVEFEGGGLGSQIINSWIPSQNRAVSDFDTTHAINH